VNKTVKTDSLNCPMALGNSRIIGPGGEVHCPCELLRRTRDGEPVDNLVERIMMD
jgi:hypothetical protein